VTPAEALSLHPGDYIASHLDDPPYCQRRVTDEPWQSAADPNVVRVRSHSWSPVDWLDLAHWVRVPKGANQFDLTLRRWVRAATDKEREQGLGARVPIGDHVPSCPACAGEREVA